MGSSVARFDCYFARSEAEARIAASVLGPGLGRRHLRQSVDAGIDLDCVELTREIGHWVEAARAWCGIDDALPVLARLSAAGR